MRQPSRRPSAPAHWLDYGKDFYAGASGRITITDQIFPDPTSDGLAVFASAGTARLHALHVGGSDPHGPHSDRGDAATPVCRESHRVGAADGLQPVRAADMHE